jgi:hypothetical protein
VKNNKSATELEVMGLPYVNDFMVSPFDSAKRAQEKCPFGYRVTFQMGSETIPDNAVRIGQCKVRTGDPEFPIYAIPISMAEAREQLASEYKNAVNKLAAIRELITNKQRIRTPQIKNIIG